MPRIEEARVTPVAFRDPPLLNAMGIHEPWALRSVIEVEIEGGIVGLGESYGDQAFVELLSAIAPKLVGLGVTDTNGLTRIVRKALAEAGAAAGTSPVRKNQERTDARVIGAFEVAMLDALGKAEGLRVCDLLGGQVREAVPFSAYLFYKEARHRFTDDPWTDPWGAALDPAGIVRQARRMVELHGFGSLKLKAGHFAPDAEIDAIAALRDAFPHAPLRIDPNAGWHVHTTLALLPRMEGLLEYLEDPVPGIPGMAVIQKATSLPLATNMCVVANEHLPPGIAEGAVKVILADHHYWGGLRATVELARICEIWGIGLSMHSNSHLGITLAAMTQVAAAVPNLTYACDTHYPWQEEEVIQGGKLPIKGGLVRVPDGPGLGVELDRTALARLHENWRTCGIRHRDDAGQMRKYDPSFVFKRPRW